MIQNNTTFALLISPESFATHQCDATASVVAAERERLAAIELLSIIIVFMICTQKAYNEEKEKNPEILLLAAAAAATKDEKSN